MVLIERWKPVPGYEGLYAVSDLGRVKSLERYVKGPPGSRSGLRINKERILTAKPDLVSGGQVVSLWRNNKGKWIQIHRLVLLAFKGPCPEGHETRHLDGNHSNNKLKNLTWGTPTENHDDKR